MDLCVLFYKFFGLLVPQIKMQSLHYISLNGRIIVN